MADIRGNNRPNTLRGSNFEDFIEGLGGNDNLVGLEGGDDLFGGDGNDRLVGGGGEDFFIGGAGNDLLDGRASRRDALLDLDFDVVRYDRDGGGRGVAVDLSRGTARDTHGNRDRLIDIEQVVGSAFADRLVSTRAGNDDFESFVGRAGADTINGGTGLNDLDYFRDFDNGGRGAITVNFVTGRATDGFGDVDTFSNITRVRLSQGADTMLGNNADNQVRAFGGNDRIDGGGGFDRVDYSQDAGRGGSRGVVVDLARGTARDGFGDRDTLIRIEHVRGTDAADRMTGDRGANRFDGQGGNDQVAGGGGVDTINGGGGVDRLAGDGGADVIAGGVGRDNLTGGLDDDRFVFNDLGDRGDVITDWQSGADTIRLDQAGFDIDTPGQNFIAGRTFVASANPVAGVRNAETVLYDTDSGVLRFDPDGRGGAAAVTLVTLQGAPVLDPGDLFFN